MTGIYIIENIKNGKVYIGKTDRTINIRLTEHYKALINNEHLDNRGKPTHLQNAWIKDGEESFIFDVLEECSPELLNEREIFWIDYYKSHNNKYGYNKTYGGDGVPHTEETRKKMSESAKGKVLSEITRKKISEKSKLYRHTKESKHKISKSHAGKKLSEKTKQKLSELNTGENHPLYGTHRSEETRKKISEGHKGKKLSDETKAKLSEINKGKKMSEETKKKISEKNKGNMPNSIQITQNMINDFDNGIRRTDFCKKYSVSQTIWDKIRLNKI